MPQKSLLRFFVLSAFSSLAFLLCLSVWPGRALSADQTIAGKSFSVIDRSGGCDEGARRVGVRAVERGSSHTIVGDPSVDGATLEIIANGTNAARQSFDLPASEWSADTNTPGTRFTYRDPKGTNGPVKKAHIRRSGGGKFSIGASIDGAKDSVESLDVVPPDSGTDGYAVLTLGGGGDRYCMQFGADGKVRNRGRVSFRVVNPTSEGCPAPAGTCVTDPSLVWSENGDGTVTQCSSGLVWEMKTDDLPSVHNGNAFRTWSTGDPWNFDGTAKTEFIDVLNDVSGGGAACFAGHCDWRLPTIEELSGIVDRSAGQCGGGCGPCSTIPDGWSPNGYWSSSTKADDPDYAWGVGFYDGDVDYNEKDAGRLVRAVRGGS